MPKASASEDSLLSKFRESAQTATRNPPLGHQVVLGIGDDAALFRPRPGYDTILTCDWFLEGTHFLRDKHPPDSVGWKCLARALSDVAAMGGVPRCFLLSMALPKPLSGRWLDDFLAGLRRASRKFQCALAGGDTTRRNNVLINVTAIGEVRKASALLRSSARPGDSVFVSGRLGEADQGLRLLRSSKNRSDLCAPMLRRHLYPEPRFALGQWLASRRIGSAMMDISDGLSSDLPRLCSASNVGARLETTKIPTVSLSPSTREKHIDPLQLALHGGDDYELLFTVSRGKRASVPRRFQGLLLTEIGMITAEEKILLLDERGRERSLDPGGWDPFRSKA